MNPARFTVPRPVFTIMATLIAVTIGIMSLSRLPIDLLPEITYPTLTITTEYENADPEEVETLLTRQVEQAVSAVPGLEEITSTSAEGLSQVQARFTWGTDIDTAGLDVRDRLDRIIDSLPEGVDRPRVRKADTSSSAVMVIGVTSDLDPLEVGQLVDQRIRQRVERVPGVAVADIWGELEREIQVRVDPDRLRAAGLSLEDVREAISQANVTIPAGEVERGRFDVRLRTPATFADVEEIANTVVDFRDGAVIRLRQIADVHDTHARISRIVRVEGEESVRIGVRKQTDANTVELSAGVHEELEQLRRDYPQLGFIVVRDSADYIQRSIDNVSRTIVYGGLLAVLVLFVFLRNIRATLVAATAIPVAVISTFALVYFGGFTLNLMTLGGLAMGVGMMVDNAIVVIENITRRREAGESERSAAVLGTGEVAAAIVASTLTTVAIFLPMFFAEELAGVMFRQLAAVVAFALIGSLVVALTLVPMLMGRSVPRRRHTPLIDGIGRFFDRLDAGYYRALPPVVRHPWLTLGVAALSLAAAVVLVPRIGTEFMPAVDEGEIRVNFDMQPGTRLEVLDRQMRRAEQIAVDSIPEKVSWLTSAGASSYRASSPATGGMRINLVPVSQRERSSEEVAAQLREDLVGLAGVEVRVRARQGLFMPGLSGGTESLVVELLGYDLDALGELAGEVERRIVDLPGITDVVLSRDQGSPQQLVRIDRDRAADLGVSVETIARTLETALGGSSAGEFREAGEEYRILVQLAGAELLGYEEILNLTLPSEDGDAVALRNVVTLEPDEGTVLIDRQDQQRVVKVSANIAGADLGSVVDNVQERIAGIPLPRDTAIELGGDYESQQDAFSELALSLLLAIALVYMVMACLYESLRDPLIVMFAVPFATIGVVLMLLATGTTLNVQSFIGCIMLVGISVNNAILLVDQSVRLHRVEGRRVIDAVTEAGRRRLRPILMTTATTILALVPLALGVGEGSEAQAPMARAVIGGLLSSMLIVLFVIPALYRLFHRDREPLPASGDQAATAGATPRS